MKDNLKLIMALKLLAIACLVTFTACESQTNNSFKTTGITNQTNSLGSVLVLQGQDEALGNKVKQGAEFRLTLPTAITRVQILLLLASTNIKDL